MSLTGAIDPSAAIMLSQPQPQQPQFPQAVERKRKFNGGANPPSCVVFVGEIPCNTCELELRRILHEFGKIEFVFTMPAKHQALVEFLRQSDAERLLTTHQSQPLCINGASLVISFSNRARIDLSQEPYLSNSPQTCLLLTVYNMKAEFNCDAVRQICSPYAIVDRCMIIRQNDGLTRAVVEFWKLEDAVITKPHLNGASMFAGCNAIRCDYARNSAFEFFASRETVLEEFAYEAEADSTGFVKRPRVMAPGCLLGNPGGGMGNPAGVLGGVVDELGNRLQGIVGRQAGDLLGPGGMNVVNRTPGQFPFGNNIIVVRGLSPEMNCDRLFNLLVLYGNVSRIKFLTTKEGFALIEMSDPNSAQQAVQHLNGQRALGNTLKVSLSDQDNVKRNTKEFMLPDGTPAERSYDTCKLNRFMTPESAAKNQVSLGRTGRILYFWGSPDGSNEELLCEVLKEAGAPAPLEVTMQNEKGTTGWITFETAQDATDAICLANHAMICESAKLKLSYAVNKKDPK